MRTGYRCWALALLCAFTLLGASGAMAFPDPADCSSCHGGFRDGNPSLHDVHRDFIPDCFMCHKGSTGAGVAINDSGSFAGHSCNGCHQEAGLVRFHILQGESCSPCHSTNQPVVAESDLPFYYLEGRSDIVNPCRVNSANGGEDWTGDNAGLDNDGDGMRDAADPDCTAIIPTIEESWSTLKTLFESE